MTDRIAFQGELGANSHMACHEAYPAFEPLPCETFEDAFAAVTDGAAALAMIPIENSLAGRVGDVHHLLPKSGLYVIGEKFARIEHQLVGAPGATLADIKRIRSHPMALGQCRNIIRSLGATAVKTADTAGAVREVAEMGVVSEAAIGSALAATIHGLPILKANVEDAAHNTTRFIVLAPEPDDAEPEAGDCITTVVFRTRNVPASLYKALGGFATNGVNMTKLESYQIEGAFHASQFYADIEGHPASRPVKLALEELRFFAAELTVLGVYPADPFRARWKAAQI